MMDSFKHALSLHKDIQDRMDKAMKRERELIDALDRAITLLASHAQETGSIHGWWDVIGELKQIANKDHV